MIVLGGGFECDVVAEGLEFGDETAGFAFRVEAGGEVVSAEVVVRGPGGQDVPDDHEHRMGDHDDRLLLRGGAAVATPFHDVAVVEGLEVALMTHGAPGGFDQDGL